MLIEIKLLLEAKCLAPWSKMPGTLRVTKYLKIICVNENQFWQPKPSPGFVFIFQREWNSWKGIPFKVEPNFKSFLLLPKIRWKSANSLAIFEMFHFNVRYGIGLQSQINSKCNKLIFLQGKAQYFHNVLY